MEPEGRIRGGNKEDDVKKNGECFATHTKAGAATDKACLIKAVIQNLLIMATSMYRLGGQFGPGRFTGLRLANNRRVRVSLTD